MHDFLREDDIIQRRSSQEKTILTWANDFGHDWAQSVNQHFRDDLEGEVEKGDGSKSLADSGQSFLGMSVMKASNTLFGTLPDRMAPFGNHVTDSPTTSQKR